MATTARSAAERVFAIAELLEEIVLHVMQDELGASFDKHKISHLNTAFKLQHINRDAYRNIAGSTKIRNLALARLGMGKLDTWDRIGWLSYESRKWILGARTRIGRAHPQVGYAHPILLGSKPRRSWLNDNPDASWRALPCLPPGTESIKLEIWQFIPICFKYVGMNARPKAEDVKSIIGENWRKRLTTWEVNDQYTLGQLYDDLVKVEYEQSVAFAKG